MQQFLCKECGMEFVSMKFYGSAHGKCLEWQREPYCPLCRIAELEAQLAEARRRCRTDHKSIMEDE